MPQINFLNSNHKLPAIIESHARPFMPKKNEHDEWRVGQLKLAIQWIQSAVLDGEKYWHTCDEAFKLLPGGQKFSDLWKDPQIWVSFQRDPDPKLFGEAVRWGKDVAVSYGSFVKGWKMVAATLIHEFAHLNGASSKTTDAEDTLLHCGLADQHRQEIIGYYQSISPTAIVYA